MNDDLNQSLLEALKKTLPEMQVKAVEERNLLNPKLW